MDSIIKSKTHEFIKLIYKVSSDFPKDEMYGLTSQLRRAAVSVMLNYVEGFARRKDKVVLNFLEISYGSIKECKYIIYLSLELGYLSKENYDKLIKLAEEISAMLWSNFKTREKHC